MANNTLADFLLRQTISVLLQQAVSDLELQSAPLTLPCTHCVTDTQSGI
jgi:hypothetical protein